MSSIFLKFQRGAGKDYFGRGAGENRTGIKRKRKIVRIYATILYICTMKQDIRIKEICKEKGITLEDLAKRLGILRTSLSQALSRNSFSTDKLSDIANALNVPMWQLFASPEEVAGSGDFVALVKDGKNIYHADSWQELEELVTNQKK